MTCGTFACLLLLTLYAQEFVLRIEVFLQKPLPPLQKLIVAELDTLTLSGYLFFFLLL